MSSETWGAWSLAWSFAKRWGVTPFEPKQIIRGALSRLGYEIRKAPRTSAPPPVELPLVDVFDLLVREHLNAQGSAYVVQIGANDGATADPVCDVIRKHRLPGLLVEPQPRAFQRLVHNYRDQPQLAFDNCLLGSADGVTTFYTVREDFEGLPFWLYQSASLDRSVVLNALRVFRELKGFLNIPADYERLVEAVSVPSVTWQTLLRKHGIAKIDVLVVDTMGFDYELLKLLPFDVVQPSIIHFEHSLLSPRDQRACLQFLASQGYSLAKIAVDTIACRDVKTRRWLVDAW